MSRNERVTAAAKTRGQSGREGLSGPLRIYWVNRAGFVRQCVPREEAEERQILRDKSHFQAEGATKRQTTRNILREAGTHHAGPPQHRQNVLELRRKPSIYNVYRTKRTFTLS